MIARTSCRPRFAVALLALAFSACNQAPPAAQAHAVSPALRAFGFDSYILDDDPAAPGRFDLRLLENDAQVGELAEEPTGDLRFSLGGEPLIVRRQDDAMIFSLGSETGTLTVDAAGAVVGDAASTALWKRAQPQLDAIEAIATELGLGRAKSGGVSVSTNSASSCRANPMYVNGIYLNVFCPINRVASCQSWLQNNCPFGRVCSNDSHPGDCFRGLEACGGYCNCSSYGTGCSSNSDCCSNNCASNGHYRACH